MREIDLLKIKDPTNWQLALREFVLATRRQLSEGIVRIVLYGSRARGDFTEDSDIDVLVVVDGDILDPDDTLINIGKLGYDILLDYNELIALHVVSEEKFISMQDYSYYQFIAEEGVSV